MHQLHVRHATQDQLREHAIASYTDGTSTITHLVAVER